MLALQQADFQAKRERLVRRFLSVPASVIEAVLTTHQGDADAATAWILDYAQSTGLYVDASCLDADTEHVRAQAQLDGMDGELRRQVARLRMRLGPSAPDVLTCAALVAAAGGSVEGAVAVLESGGVPAPRGEQPAVPHGRASPQNGAASHMHGKVEQLQARLPRPHSHDTLCAVLAAAGGSVEEALDMLREADSAEGEQEAGRSRSLPGAAARMTRARQTTGADRAADVNEYEAHEPVDTTAPVAYARGAAAPPSARARQQHRGALSQLQGEALAQETQRLYEEFHAESKAAYAASNTAKQAAHQCRLAGDYDGCAANLRLVRQSL